MFTGSFTVSIKSKLVSIYLHRCAGRCRELDLYIARESQTVGSRRLNQAYVVPELKHTKATSQMNPLKHMSQALVGLHNLQSAFSWPMGSGLLS